MIATGISAGEAAVIAASIAAVSQLIPWAGKAWGKRRLDSRRETLQELRADSDRLNGSYRRLETENQRLWAENARLRERITSLETAVNVECARADKMERALRTMGKMPDGEPE